MKLLVKHPYYCSESNYYSHEPQERFETFSDFYDDYHDADIDMNLIFRFDISQDDDTGEYSADIFMIQQRKGIFKPIAIDRIEEKDEELMTQLLTKHWERLKEMWNPISKTEFKE